MSKLVRRVLMLALAATLGTLGTMVVASAASAISLSVTTVRASTLRACDTAGCTASTPQVPAGSNGTSFCILNNADLVYTGPGDRRGGFLPRADLSDRTQFTRCNDNPQFGIVVVSPAQLRFCTSGCQPFGATVPQNSGAAAFCVRSTFVLVYVPPLAGSSAGNRGGFLPRSALAGNIPTASC